MVKASMKFLLASQSIWNLAGSSNQFLIILYILGTAIGFAAIVVGTHGIPWEFRKRYSDISE